MVGRYIRTCVYCLILLLQLKEKPKAIHGSNGSVFEADCIRWGIYAYIKHEYLIRIE